MSQLGMGVMINMLGGSNDNAQKLQNAIGKTIVDLDITENTLSFDFADGSDLHVFDDGQSCCENRYMNTDDNLEYYRGSKLLGMEIRDVTEEDDGDWGDVKESQFLVINTDKGSFTVANYNEHNGYYGGFYLRLT